MLSNKYSSETKESSKSDHWPYARKWQKLYTTLSLSIKRYINLVNKDSTSLSSSWCNLSRWQAVNLKERHISNTKSVSNPPKSSLSYKRVTRVITIQIELQFKTIIYLAMCLSKFKSNFCMNICSKYETYNAVTIESNTWITSWLVLGSLRGHWRFHYSS